MKISKLATPSIVLILSSVFLSSQSANAAKVSYTIEGNLSLSGVVDDYNLNGAYFQWVVSFDTKQPMFTSNTFIKDYTTSWYETIPSSYPNTSSTVTFTNRSNGAADATVNTGRVAVSASNSAGANVDGLGFGPAYLEGEFTNLFTDPTNIAFTQDVYGADGLVALPTSWSPGQVLYINMPIFNTATDTQYTITGGNISVSLSSVPVPAAVWLFGSGLLGLLVTSRRKART